MNRKLFIVLLCSVFCIILSSTVIFAVDDTSVVLDDASYDAMQDNNSMNHVNFIKDDKQIKADDYSVSDYSQIRSSLDKKKNQTYNLENKTYTVDKQLIVEGSKDLTINGNGAVLDAKNQKVSFINFAANNLVIKDVTFKNFQSEANGVVQISSKSNATIRNCNFINIAGTSRGAIINKYNLKLINCSFEKVDANNGAALSSIGNNGKITVEGCTFKNNVAKADSNQLIQVTGIQTINIKNNTFENNKMKIINNYQDSNMTLSNNNFNNFNKQYSSTLQGALITNYEANMNLYNNTFNNITLTAPRIGGGLIYNEIGKFKMIDNKFSKINLIQTGNDRIAGGIIWNRNTTSDISRNYFDVNSKSYNIAGGVIYNNIANLTVTNNTFLQKATVDNEVAGASIYNDYDPNLKISSRLTYGDNSFGGVTLTKEPKILLNKTIRNKGIIKLIGAEDKVFNKTANIQVTVPNSIQTGKTATFKLTVTDAATNQKLNGIAIIKVNGLTLKDANNKNIQLKVSNGQATLNHSLRGYSARTHNITAVFSKTGYSRAENSTTMTVTKADYAAFTFTFDACSEKVITINKTLKDSNGNILGGNNRIAIKVGDRTVLSTITTDGVLNAKFTVPYLPQGKVNITITLGQNYRYNMKKFVTSANIHKQNVTVTITNITAKAGENITIKAKLLNDETKTNVLSGKYIFKVNGKQVPLIENNTQIKTTKIVSNGIAQWNYQLPNDLKAGKYDILLSYNGNTQSNPVRYSSKALTIIT